jgi:hypothetical protein
VEPRYGSTVKGSVEIQTNVNENGDVRSVDFTIDDVLIHTDTSAPFYYTWDTQNYENKTYTIKVNATCRTGEQTSDEVTVMVYNYNLDLDLQASRIEEKSWLVKKHIGKIEIRVTGSGSISGFDFIVYKKKGPEGDFERLFSIPGIQMAGGNHIHYDKYLDKDKSYTYKAVVQDSNGYVILTSDEETI